jgi:Tfp pilus assembly protein PilF
VTARHSGRVSPVGQGKFGQPDKTAIVLYVFALVAFVIAALVPQARIWGFNWWGYFPWWAILTGLLIAVILGRLAYRMGERAVSPSGEMKEISPRLYWGLAAGTTITAAIAFLLWPATTYFSGDGYQLLSHLGTGKSISKDWDIGATQLIAWVYRMRGEGGIEGALATYRLFSFAAGMLATAGTLLLVSRIPGYRLPKLLLAIGLLTGGYMLLFFGHVENYCLLVAVVLLYSLAGYLVVMDRLSVAWLLPIIIAAIFLHFIALALVPSFVYLLFRRAGVLSKFATLSKEKRVAVGGLLVLLGGAVYFVLQQKLLFLQFALLPIYPDRFAVEGEWLFSPKHLIDMLNLIILMAPASILLLINPWKRSGTSGPAEVSRYFWVLILSLAGLVFVMRSGIGMPRDWDLFAVIGPPILLATLATLFQWGEHKRWVVSVVGLAIALNLLMLIPRVIVNANDEMAVSHFRAYLDLDFLRGRNARRLLVDFYREKGMPVAAEREQAKAESDYPESRLAQTASRQLAEGKYAEAAVSYRQVIEINPLFSDAWANLGACLMSLNQLDSALAMVRIADQLNHRNSETVNLLGVIYTRLQRFAEAEDQFNLILSQDKSFWRAYGNLAYLRLKNRQYGETVNLLRTLSRIDSKQPDLISAMGDSLLAAGARGEAIEAYGIAMKSGLNDDRASSLKAVFPELGRP